MQNSTFTIPQWSSSVEFGITVNYHSGQLRHARSQNTNLSCRANFHFLLQYVITIHQC